MENTEKQRTSKQVFSEEDIDRITNNLRKLPEVKKEVKISKTELIRRLSTEIESLKARGYTMDQISESLRGEGIEINTPTLKSYLQRAKHATRSKAKVKPKTTKKASIPETSTSPEQLAGDYENQLKESKQVTQKPQSESSKKARFDPIEDSAVI